MSRTNVDLLRHRSAQLGDGRAVDVRVKLVAQKIRRLHIAEGPRALDRARRRPECEGSAGVLVDRAGPMKIGTRARVGYNLRAAVEPGFRLPNRYSCSSARCCHP